MPNVNGYQIAWNGLPASFWVPQAPQAPPMQQAPKRMALMVWCYATSAAYAAGIPPVNTSMVLYDLDATDITAYRTAFLSGDPYAWCLTYIANHIPRGQASSPFAGQTPVAVSVG